MRVAPIVLGGALLLLVLVIVLIGPWPVVSGRRAIERPLERALQEIVAERWSVGDGEALYADWATVPIELPDGTPLAGYGDRRGAPATGHYDTLVVGAVVLGTPDETGRPAARAAIIASDLLVVTPRIADRVRSSIDLPILFNATHTHSGPGAAMPGLIGRAFGGRYQAKVEQAIIAAMVDALRTASRLRPVTASYGVVEASDLIRNRARNQSAEYPLVDPFLDLIRLEDAYGSGVTIVRYSAHATIIGSDNRRFSAGYPGFLRSALEAGSGDTAMFLAGAVGSMSPLPPEASDDFRRARLYAELLAGRVADEMVVSPLEVDVLAIVDTSPLAPPLQLRIAPRLRVSPVFLALNGIRRPARITAVRLGSLVLIGFPGDLSGEIGADLRRWGAKRDTVLVPMSFSGAYLGYISPDAYYGDLRDGAGLAYETGIMSWTGPGQERFFVTLAQAAVRALLP